MNTPDWVRRSRWIARIERTRRRRQFGRSTTVNVLRAIAIVGLSIIGGVVAHEIGRQLVRGALTIPLDVVRAATTAIVVLTLTTMTRRASTRFDRIDFDHLLTTVPARDVVLGVAGFLYSRYAMRLALPVVGVAAGFTLGGRAPISLLVIVLTLVALLALVVMASVTLSLVGEYLALRSPRYRRYRTVLVYGPLVLLMFVLTSPGISIDRVVVWLQSIPIAWVVDLALLGAPGVDVGVGRSVGAICLLVGGVPALTLAAAALGDRVWGVETVGSASLHRSRSIVGDGLAERLFSGWVSRPVLTVARKRWVQEPRLPRGVTTIAAVLLLVGNGVGLYSIATFGIPAVTPLLIAFACAVGTGIGFGEYVIAMEYPSLPMTLTTVSGRQFVRGTILAGLGVGVPLTTLFTIVAGIVSPVGVLEILLIIVLGNVLCGCSVVVAIALGMRFEYTEFLMLPFKLPLASIRRVYGRIGRSAFLSVGTGIGVVGLVTLPAFLSHLPAVVTPLTTRLGTTSATVRIGALVVTAVLAVAVSVRAYRRAVDRYDEYTLP